VVTSRDVHVMYLTVLRSGPGSCDCLNKDRTDSHMTASDDSRQ